MNLNANPTPLAPANIGSENKIGQDIALDSISFAAYDIQSKYHNKYGLYKTLKKKGDFNDALLTSFRNNNSNTTLGEFYNADSLFLEGVLTNDSNKINNALFHSQNATPNNLPEQHQVDFNSIYTHYLMNRTLDSTNLANLYILAYLCPVQDGEAVFQARTLLTQFDTVRIYNSCEFESGDSQNSRMIFDGLSQNTTNISVYPNPSTGLIYINIKTNEEVNALYEFTLNDLAGKIVKKEKTKANSISEIDCAFLESGMYFYKLMLGNEIIQKGKIIFVK